MTGFAEHAAADQKEHGTVEEDDGDPRDGIRYNETLHGAILGEHIKYPEDAEGADADEGDEHGFDGVSETAEGAADGVHDTAEKIS